MLITETTLQYPTKFKFQFTCKDAGYHAKYYTCQNLETAICQFQAGCEHKGTEYETVSVFRWNSEDRVWKLISNADKL